MLPIAFKSGGTFKHQLDKNNRTIRDIRNEILHSLKLNKKFKRKMNWNEWKHHQEISHLHASSHFSFKSFCSPSLRWYHSLQRLFMIFSIIHRHSALWRLLPFPLLLYIARTVMNISLHRRHQAEIRPSSPASNQNAQSAAEWRNEKRQSHYNH